MPPEEPLRVDANPDRTSYGRRHRQRRSCGIHRTPQARAMQPIAAALASPAESSQHTCKDAPAPATRPIQPGLLTRILEGHQTKFADWRRPFHLLVHEPLAIALSDHR